jgi:hypothetical protein
VIGGEIINGPDGTPCFLHPTIIEEVNGSMMLYYTLLKQAPYPILSLNRFSDLDYVEKFMKCSDA